MPSIETREAIGSKLRALAWVTGCGVLGLAALLIANETSFEQRHNSAARGAVRVSVPLAKSRRMNITALLSWHAESLRTTTANFKDTIYEGVYSEGNQTPAKCTDQCDVYPEPEDKPSKHFNRVAIACPAVLFVGPQWMYCKGTPPAPITGSLCIIVHCLCPCHLHGSGHTTSNPLSCVGHLRVCSRANIVLLKERIQKAMFPNIHPVRATDTPAHSRLSCVQTRHS